MRCERSIGVLAAVGLHGALAALLVSYAPAHSTLLAAAPAIMVEILTPPTPAVEPKPVPRIEPPEHKPPVRKKKAQVRPPVQPPPPALVTPPETPVQVEAPPPPPAPPVEVAAVPVAESAPVPTAEPEPTPPAPAPAALPVTDPIFNADYLHNPAPDYPVISRRIGEQGRVILRVLVSPAGIAEEIQVRTSSGYPRLDEAARTTVARWRFVPAKRGEQPVAAWVLIPISFRLEG